MITLRHAFFALAGLGASCGGGLPTAPSPAPAAEHASAHLTFRHTAIDAATIAATAAAVEAHHGRITADLSVAQMPRVVVWLHADRASLQDAVRPYVGAVPAAASGLVTAADTIHILSPNLEAVWPYGAGVTGIVHEFAHCVSMRLNPSIPNNPRWLWEAVAVYEAGQRVDWRTVPRMNTEGPPGFRELNAMDSPLIYQVGYSLGEFIVAEWGRQGLAALVQSNGDTERTLSLSEAAFLTRWFEFARSRS